MKNKTIYNCHAHIFTLNHVPENFGRTIVPKWITLTLIKKVYLWLDDENNWLWKLGRFLNGAGAFVKKIIVVGWVYRILKTVLLWIGKILLDFFQFEAVLSDEFKDLKERYFNLLRYTISDPGRDKAYGGQDFVLRPLIAYYPADTKFVILPMDMEYMGAGPVKDPYKNQIDQIIALKNSDYYGDSIIPFAFIDPRRIKEDPAHIDYIIDLVENKGFRGLKMYPALGYYPFDSALMPIYEYALDKDLPIMTHCIKGSVYYRGEKKKEWEQHPIIRQEKGGKFVALPQAKNSDFSNNFTHPLNYECLLNPELLNTYLNRPDSERLDLSRLKICLAHFGGEYQWRKYLDDGWSNFGKEDLLNRKKNTLELKDPNQIWNSVSWLPIICDLMRTYGNIYTDISYILHDEQLMPTLNYLLSDNSTYRERILFGTDYYVTNTQKTEKALLSNIQFYLTKPDFELISHDNPRVFLNES